MDHDQILNRLNQRKHDRAVIFYGAETDPHKGESDLDRFIRVMAGPKPVEVKADEAQTEIPLNGAQVLRAALGGGHGTINAPSSTAALVADVIAGRYDHSG
ncbi:hypothetical protein [Rhodococcus sp. T7]|uniref:hypothetical protein n=1 Tax=Rhodococcus sp. T7 TaxID=627444 RepID=UPI00135BA909|nr:hypothetical protein [Rhodococcus sp. T7]KAF0964650.1 hypothetical protein MLGJGCBP_02193 [Rhodococcus sp. T7]